jgi:hypothetical protein
MENSVNIIQKQAVQALLISAQVPPPFIFLDKKSNDWGKYQGVMIPTSLLRDVCMAIGIDQVKNRQNFRNWIKQAAGIKGIPEGKLTLISINQAKQMLPKCFAHLAKTAPEGYKEILKTLSENLLFSVLESGTITRMLTKLPKILDTKRDPRITESIIKFDSPNKELLNGNEIFLLRQVVPDVFFNDLLYPSTTIIEAKECNYLLEHIREICFFIGLTEKIDVQLINKWLCKSANISRFADSRGLTLLSFEQSTNVIAIALTRLLKIYTGQKMYISSEDVPQNLKNFAINIMLQIYSEKTTSFNKVLKTTSNEFYPKKRLKGGKYF